MAKEKWLEMRNAKAIRRKVIPANRAPAKLSVEQGLAQAFVTFTQAAGSLEKSYTALQSEVVRLREELRSANVELEHSLEENARVRGYLAQVLENLPCGVVVMSGAEGKVQVLNPQARQLLQIAAEGTEGSPEARPERLARLVTADTTDKTNREQEWQDERGRWIAASCARLNDGGQPNADRIWIVRETTEQKRAAAERERAQQAVALAEITTLLAHEIRNPLGSMELFTGLLEEAVANTPETRQWVNHLRAGLRSLSATVNNVLQFHTQGALQRVPVDLDRLLGEVTDFLLPVARQRGQQIHYENAIGRVQVAADANRLKQVFLNLALNAFRAMPPGGLLRIRLGWAPQFPGGLARVEVQDEGRGIAAELLEKIFEPGFTTTPGSPGLGLAVCRKIVEQHGGAMEVQSKLSEGTRFTIVLPVAGDTA
jgi:two-component system sensor histidine kinase FlrB